MNSKQIVDYERALLFGSFDKARQVVLENSETATAGDLKNLVEKLGIDGKTALLLVDTIMKVSKRQVVAEVKKQTENLLYCVDRV